MKITFLKILLTVIFTPLIINFRYSYKKIKQENPKYLLKHTSKPFCNCSTAKGCFQIGLGKRARWEVLGFAGNSPAHEYMNWSYVSSIAWVEESDVASLCSAHENGVRVLLAAPTFDLHGESTSFDDWVTALLQKLDKFYFDGVVFDFEKALEFSDPLNQKYADLIRRTKRAFTKHTPELVVVVCLPWGTFDVDGREYMYRELVNIPHFVYIMGYDMSSQMYSHCLASSNSPLEKLEVGLRSYLKLTEDASKLILGVPWYGYKYPCTNELNLIYEKTMHEYPLCQIMHRSFKGAPCSDATGEEVPVNVILETLNTSSGLILYDEVTRTFVASIENGLKSIQFWFDLPRSLREKTSLAKKYGFGGVGPYSFSYFPFNASNKESVKMWESLL
eukprot:snap_masked-scaffold_1-processed-gene-20.23-mRNA-1 protein AED:1.00 eAED:1.00 QI:0/0/0/0/1/1/2/0/389